MNGVRALIVANPAPVIFQDAATNKMGSMKLDDMMGMFDAHNAEQLEFIDILYDWKERGRMVSSPCPERSLSHIIGCIQEVVSPAHVAYHDRDVLLVSGDVHFAFVSVVYSKGARVFNQMVTSAVSNKKITFFEQMAAECVQRITERLSDDISFEHTEPFTTDNNYGKIQLNEKRATNFNYPQFVQELCVSDEAGGYTVSRVQESDDQGISERWNFIVGKDLRDFLMYVIAAIVCVVCLPVLCVCACCCGCCGCTAKAKLAQLVVGPEE